MAPPTGNGGVGPDEVAAATADAWARFVDALPGGWYERRGGAIAVVSGAAVPTLNGVWAESSTPDADVLGDLLARVAATGLPHCLQLRPPASAELRSLAQGHGLMFEESIPLMVLEDRSGVQEGADPADLTLRVLEPDEAELHVITAASGFGAPESVFRAVITEASLRVPGVLCYLGEAGGHPVTTGLGVTTGDAVGIFNIATPPEHRGRGYGTAVTARAARDGLDGSARYAFLQSSPEGFPVYQRLGFHALEEWDCWVSTTPAG